MPCMQLLSLCTITEDEVYLQAKRDLLGLTMKAPPLSPLYIFSDIHNN